MSEYPPELVDTIAEAMWEADSRSTSHWPGRRTLAAVGEAERRTYTGLALTALDAIAEDPQRSIVELPEPNSTRYEGDEHEPVDRPGWWMPGSLFGVTQWGYPNQVQLAFDGEPFEPLSLDEARFIAAALLAAAAVAERGETDHG